MKESVRTIEHKPISSYEFYMEYLVNEAQEQAVWGNGTDEIVKNLMQREQEKNIGFKFKKLKSKSEQNQPKAV